VADKLLRGQAARGRTVLVSSHLLAEAQQTVDDVVVIAEGRLRAQGPPAELVTPARSLEDAFLELTEAVA
jgi:ABC-2 type transport system ATP-binding protein